MESKTTLIVVALVVLVHFIVGIAFLVYKVTTAKKPTKKSEEENVNYNNELKTLHNMVIEELNLENVYK